jgi:hypothetical protein
VAGRKWYWNYADPAAVPAILFDDKEPNNLMIMPGMKMR